MSEPVEEKINKKIKDAEETQKDLYLSFRLAEEDFGMEIFHVIEIVGIQKITEVPDMPEYIRGVINLRGSVIPVMDVRLRFGMPEREYDERTCMIVVSVEGITMALVVDRVNEVSEIPISNIEPAPKTGSGESYIRGMGKLSESVMILLDMEDFISVYEGVEDNDEDELGVA